MERTPNCCSPASLVALIILVLFPVRSWSTEETYKLLKEAKPDGCLSGDAALKRFDDIDYDSFVSLMGRRSAAPPNSQRNAPVSKKRRIDRILADLLGQRTRMAFPQPQRYLQTSGGRSIDHGKQRIQRFL